MRGYAEFFGNFHTYHQGLFDRHFNVKNFINHLLSDSQVSLKTKAWTDKMRKYIWQQSKIGKFLASYQGIRRF